jgi:hypothetical protein
MFLAWVALDGFARSAPPPEDDGTPNREPDVSRGAEAAAYLWMAFFAAGAILIHAHWEGMMRVALVLSSAMFGVAVAAWAARVDASAALPAGVAFLPGLMLAARSSLPDNAVPTESFWLVALAPLVLLPFLVPFLARRSAWYLRVLRALLVLAPLVTAVVLAAKYETIATQDEW